MTVNAFPLRWGMGLLVPALVLVAVPGAGRAETVIPTGFTDDVVAEGLDFPGGEVAKTRVWSASL